MAEMNRREFVAAATAAACACMFCPAAVVEAATGPVDAGPAAEFAKNGISTKFVGKGFFVVTQNGRIHAPASACTHKQVQLKPVGGSLKCAKHGSAFDPSGKVTKGPAKVSLPRCHVSINEQGHLIVNPAQKFDEKKWNAPGASVEVPKG